MIPLRGLHSACSLYRPAAPLQANRDRVMNTSVKLLVIVLLVLVMAYAHVAAASANDHALQRLEGRWHVVGLIGEQEIRYAATATLKLAGQVLRLDLAEAGSAAQAWMTWILSPDTHNGQIVCFAIDATDRAQGPFAATLWPMSDDRWRVTMHAVDGPAEQPPVAEYLLHRA